MKRTLLIITVVCLKQTLVSSQDFKFGKVSQAALQEKYYPADSTADAAYLYKNKEISYFYNGDQGWKLITEVHERIKLFEYP